jgi:hypothetical protein
MKKARTCNRNEKALTWNTSEFSKKFKFRQGDKFELHDVVSGLSFPVYVNRADCSTLYCPNRQIPMGFSNRAKVGQPLTFAHAILKRVI